MFRFELGPDAHLAILETRHAAGIYALVDANRAHLEPWFPWVEAHTDTTEAARFIQSQLDTFAARTGHCCGIWLGERLVGTIGCHKIDARTQSGEIGYWLAKDATGHGLMTRAAAVMIDYLIADRGLHRVVIRARVDNGPSRAVAERLGFVHEGTERGGEHLRGVIRDVAVYSLLAPEWRARAATR